MNYETINYAYLAGYLESEMKSLAYDKKFLTLSIGLEREEYIRSRIQIANDEASKYARSLVDA